ncbi:hypothetical protein ABFS83_08G145100 [Erythranthe nasuta]
MHAKLDFVVKVSGTEVVAAALPMQEHLLPLSNLDLLLPPVDFGVFFCYDNRRRHELTFDHMVGVLKNSLAQTLVPYYPFAGELVKNGAGEPELLCNNGGVDFIEASADVEFKDLDFYNPDDTVEGKLVPARKHGVLAVQATQLKHGGLVVACTFAHQVADAYSANMFLVSWAETAQSKPLSRPPSFRRSLLLPRLPGGYHQSVDDMYVNVSSIPPPPQQNEPLDNDDRLPAAAAMSRIYYIKADQVNQLQAEANVVNSGTRRTKMEAFCAFIWKTIASGEDSAGDNHCRLGVVVDGRNRLIDDDGDEIESYFGNVLSIPFGEKKITELIGKPLNWAACEVHAFLQAAVTREHFLGLIDWVEERRPEKGVSRIYAAVAEEEAAVVVSSGQRFPVREMDYGWGNPAFGSYHFPWGGKSGYVMPMPSPNGNGDWIVYIHLMKAQLDLIESIAARVFNPITRDYLLSLAN